MHPDLPDADLFGQSRRQVRSDRCSLFKQREIKRSIFRRELDETPPAEKGSARGIKRGIIDGLRALKSWTKSWTKSS
jgi:hypothetical protein